MLLNNEPGFQVVGLAIQTKGLVDQIAATEPDVLMLDWQLTGEPMGEMIANIRALDFQLKIIVVSIRPEDKSAAMATGANYFATKNSPPDELLAILGEIRQTPADGTPFAREVE